MTLRKLNIIPLLLLVLLIPASKYYPGVQWWGFGVIIAIQLVIVVYGCINISSGYFLPVLCRARTNEKVVALTFDDGPHPAYTNDILSILSTRNAPATFFVIGRNIAGNEQVLKQTVDNGHLLGNHSYSHNFWFDMRRPGKMLDDMRRNDKVLKSVAGVQPVMFRPPYGVTNPNIRSAVLKGKYVPVGWSIRSLDTKIKDKEKLLSRITRRLKPGAIILLHDSMEITAQILPELIEQIRSKGYEIRPLDEMLNMRAYV